jgi:hypothetical protein
MKLFLLKLPESDKVRWDSAYGFVIAAESHHQARKIAAEHCGDEGPETWLNPNKSSCSILNPDKTFEGVILRDFCAG